MAIAALAGMLALGACLSAPLRAVAQPPVTQCVTNAQAGGTGDAITVPLLPCGLATNILELTLTAANSTTSPTLQMTGFPALPIRSASGGSIAAGALPGAGAVVLLAGTGSSWLLLTNGVLQTNQNIINTVADMEALGGSSATFGTITLLGYNAAYDHGGGTFTWVGGITTATDGCTVFAANGVSVGRWVRLVGQAQFTPQSCGAWGDGTHSDSAAFAAALTAGAAAGLGQVYCPDGTYKWDSGTGIIQTNQTLQGSSLCEVMPSALFPAGTKVLSTQSVGSVIGITINGANVVNTGVVGLGCEVSISIDTCQAPFVENVNIINFNTTNSIGWDAGSANKAVGVSVNADTNYINIKLGKQTGYSGGTFVSNFNCFGCLTKSAGYRNIWSVDSSEIFFYGGENVNAQQDGLYAEASSGCTNVGFHAYGMHFEGNWQSATVGASRNGHFQATENAVCGFVLRDAHFEPLLGGSGSCNQQAKPLAAVDGRDIIIDNPNWCTSGAGNLTVSGVATVQISNYPAGINGQVGASITAAMGYSGCVYTISDYAVTVAQLPPAPCAGSKALVSDATQTLTAGIGATVVGSGADTVPVGFDGTNWLIGG